MRTNDEPFAITKPPRPWLRWLKRLGKIVLLAILAIAIRQAWHYHEATKKLQETLEELDRTEPGWRLEDIEAAREPIPEDENSARVIVAAAQLLPKDWPPKQLGDALTDLSPEEQLAPEQFKRLKQELEKIRPALNIAHKLVSMPRGRHHLQYKSFVLDTVLNDQQATRRVVNLFTYDALRYDHERDLSHALSACQAAFHAARSVGDEPFAISQLIRMAGVFQSCQGIERALAQGEPSSENLVELQDLLRQEDDFSDMTLIARGERASLHETFSTIERADVPLSHDFFGRRPSWEEHLFGWFTREKFREAHPSMLAAMSRLVAIARLPLHDQAAAERELDKEIRKLMESTPLAVLLIPGLQKVAEASRRKHAYLRCTETALAAERYRQAHKKWPDSLDTLCPQFLTANPLDPFDGQSLRYRRVEDGVIIYSVSSDRTDNNGNLDATHPNQPGVDIGFRLWDVAKRRQPPRATPVQ